MKINKVVHNSLIYIFLFLPHQPSPYSYRLFYFILQLYKAKKNDIIGLGCLSASITSHWLQTKSVRWQYC